MTTEKLQICFLETRKKTMKKKRKYGAPHATETMWLGLLEPGAA